MSHKEQIRSIIKSLSAVGKPEGGSLQPEKKAAIIFHMVRQEAVKFHPDLHTCNHKVTFTNSIQW